jgi:ankyrin repeat protein
MLIQHGANVAVKAKDGRTPLMIAVSEGNNEMLELLRNAGAKF